MKLNSRIVGIIFSLLCGIFIFLSAAKYWDLVVHELSNPSLFLPMLMAVVTYLVAIFFGWVGWLLILGLLGLKAPRRDTFYIFMVSSVGKYVPGNVFQYLGRIFLASRLNISKNLVVISIILEFSMFLGLGFLISSIYSFSYMKDVLGDYEFLLYIVFLIFVICILFLFFLSNIRLKFINIIERALNIGWVHSIKFLFLSIFSSLTVFLFLGMSAYFIVQGISQETPISLLNMVSYFAAAWVVGFLTPGAPAGLGSRDAVLQLLLSPTIGVAPAVAVVLLCRFATIVGDCLGALIGLAFSTNIRINSET